MASAPQFQTKPETTKSPPDMSGGLLTQTMFDVTVLTGKQIVVLGGVQCGKSTLADELQAALGYEVFRTDDLIETLEWSECSQAAMHWLFRPGSYILEGMAMARSLRRALQHSDLRPCTDIVRLTRPHVTLSKGQAAMSAGEVIVWRGVLPELYARGVTVHDV